MRERLQVNVTEGDTCTGISQQCPPPTIKVEKVNGGLRLFGVVIGNNCQVSLPAFGVLFVFIGIILTIVAFKKPGIDEDPSEYENREETAKNIRILGPVCIFVGIAMLVFAGILKYLSTKAQDKQTRIGFYCPVHGDFYPLSPGINPRKYSFSEVTQDKKWWSWTSLKCMKKNQSSDPIVSDIPPCPHSISPSNRSSFDGQHAFQISSSNPNTVTINAPCISDGLGSSCENFSTNENYYSVRSLSVPNDVASFPIFRSRSNPPTSPPTPINSAVANAAKRLSCPILPEIGAISPLQIAKLGKPSIILNNVKTELKVVQPAISNADRSVSESNNSTSSDEESKKRKSVSILLPVEDLERGKAK